MSSHQEQRKILLSLRVRDRSRQGQIVVDVRRGLYCWKGIGSSAARSKELLPQLPLG